VRSPLACAPDVDLYSLCRRLLPIPLSLQPLAGADICIAVGLPCLPLQPGIATMVTRCPPPRPHENEEGLVPPLSQVRAEGRRGWVSYPIVFCTACELLMYLRQKIVNMIPRKKKKDVPGRAVSMS
jgi:hypothetical protein